jgi:hypothetical protein
MAKTRLVNCARRFQQIAVFLTLGEVSHVYEGDGALAHDTHLVFGAVHVPHVFVVATAIIDPVPQFAPK